MINLLYVFNIILRISTRLSTLTFKENDEVDEKKLEDFKKSIDHYFNLYAPGNEDFKELIKIISIYLTFIVKKPLHPPGIIFSNGTTVYQNGDSYYCTGREFS